MPRFATFEEARDAAFASTARGDDDVVAYEALRVAHGLRPEAYGVNVKLGQVCGRLGRHEEAAAAYERALAARPDDLASLVALANRLVEAGAWQRARDVLPQLAAAPGHAGAALLLEVRMLEGDPPGEHDPVASTLLERALALPAEESAGPLTALGKWLLEHREFELSHRAFLGAVESEPADTGVLKGLSAVCWRLGRETEAQRWQEVLELMLGLKDNVFTREQTTKSGAASQLSAIEHSEYIRLEIEAHGERLQRLVEIHPGWAQGFLDLAELQAGRGEVEAACATVQAYLGLHGAGLSAVEREALRKRYCH